MSTQTSVNEEKKVTGDTIDIISIEPYQDHAPWIVKNRAQVLTKEYLIFEMNMDIIIMFWESWIGIVCDHIQVWEKKSYSPKNLFLGSSAMDAFDL